MFNEVVFIDLLLQVSSPQEKKAPEHLLALSEYINQFDKKDCAQCVQFLFQPSRTTLDLFILYVIEHHPENEMGRLFDGAMVDMAIRTKKSGNTNLAHFLLDKLKERRYPNIKVDVHSWLDRDPQPMSAVSTIGSGAYGIVTYGLDKKNQQRAVKTFTYPQNSEEFDLDTFETIFREAIFLRYLTDRNAPNFVQFVDAHLCVPQPIITMSYASAGNLQNFIIKSPVHAQTLHVDFMTQINAGLCFLHQNDIVHRDIKPSNILLNLNEKGGYTLTICDAGTTHFKKYLALSTACVSTRIYAAPESLSGKEETEKVDVYSLAVLWFLFWKQFQTFHPYGDKKYPPNIEKNSKEAFDYLHGSVPIRPSINTTSAPQWCKTLIESMWSVSPDKRPSTQAIEKQLALRKA